MPPLPPPVCLVRSYESRGIKGGTVIAEHVLDLATHQQMLADPDCYRAVVGACRNCGGERIHALCFRQRVLRPADAQEASLVVDIRLFRCARRGCGAVFTMLPAFIARHLWRAWATVERSARGLEQPPKSTRRRWLSRLASDASDLAQSFVSLAAGVLEASFLRQVSRSSTRRDVIEVASEAIALHFGHVFAAVAGWIHRLRPGVRLL